MQIQGTIKLIQPIEQINSNFKKREVIITIQNGDYKDDVSFQLLQEQTNLLNGFQVGQKVDCAFNLRGKEWKGKEGVKKYYNSLVIWSMKAA